MNKFRLSAQYNESPAKKPATAKISAKQWMKNSISIWSDVRKSKEELALKHPAMFPSSLASRLIQCFPETNFIIDPFAGVGSTLIAAKMAGIPSIGIELNPEYAALAQQRISQIIPFEGEAESIIINENSNKINNYITEPYNLLITSPPYWNILLEKRTDKRTDINYGDEKDDIGKIDDYEDFLEELQMIMYKALKKMVNGGNAVINVMDIRKQNNFYPFHIHIIIMMEILNMKLQDIIIWDRRLDYNYLKPLGYPKRLIVNKTHEYLMIFKKDIHENDNK